MTKKKESRKCLPASTCGGGGYFVGFIGAAVYWIQMATSFEEGIVGFLKALVWPAFLAYELLKYLGA